MRFIFSLSFILMINLSAQEDIHLFYKILFSDYPNVEEMISRHVIEDPCLQLDRDRLATIYFSGEFTTVDEQQFIECVNLTENPPWSNHQSIQEYYQLHEETPLDLMLRLAACQFANVIIHGDIDQEKLSQRLKRFDIAKLLECGPIKQGFLSYEAQKLIYDNLHGIKKVYDIHLHNLGYDEGNYLNPNNSVRGLAGWKDYFTFMVLRYASGTRSPLGSTHEARKRIHLYAAHFPKLTAFILPIHQAILANGEVRWDKTGNYLNNYSANLTAASFAGTQSKIMPAVSIHPFEPMWKEKLLKSHAEGVRLVKWMPPQSVPPDDERIKDFYVLMSQLEMKLIAHTGPEHTIPTSVENKNWQDFGNPLRFRMALAFGVDVIFAHCGHKDLIPDLDQLDHPLVSGHELFFRVARETHQKNLTGEWKGKAYGDLAAVTTHYGVDFIKTLLLHVNEEGIRYVYGSDYPHTNLIQPQKDAYDLCSEAGLLAKNYVKPLKEIREWNPLLANYVFTRILETIGPNQEKLSFPESTFTGEFKDGELILWKS